MRTGAVYDTGALIAAERGHRGVLDLHSQILASGSLPVVPLVVLAQAWRDGPQARLSRLLAGCLPVPEDEETAKAAGVACALSGTSDVVDALVVVTAAARNLTVVTSHPLDIRRIARALRLDLTLVRVS